MRIQKRIHGGDCLTFDFESTQDVKNWLKEIKNDKIINILIKKSNLTKIQFETFILDLIFRINRINSLDNNKLTRYLGLKNGDIIHSINGQILTSKQKAFQVFKKALTQSQMDIELLRNQKKEMLSFALK